MRVSQRLTGGSCCALLQKAAVFSSQCYSNTASLVQQHGEKRPWKTRKIPVFLSTRKRPIDGTVEVFIALFCFLFFGMTELLIPYSLGNTLLFLHHSIVACPGREVFSSGSSFYCSPNRVSGEGHVLSSQMEGCSTIKKWCAPLS